jgi:hypothetical protein
MAGTDRAGVDTKLRAGALACPGCRGPLAPWGHARERALRGEYGQSERLRPRRARCGWCLKTHVLLPVVCLARRADVVAAGLGRAASTVRGWLRAFAANAGQIQAVFTALLHELDPLAGPEPVAVTAFAGAVQVIGAVAAAVRRRLGVVGTASPWRHASALSGGLLLASPVPAGAANTSWPWAAAG